MSSIKQPAPYEDPQGAYGSPQPPTAGRKHQIRGSSLSCPCCGEVLSVTSADHMTPPERPRATEHHWDPHDPQSPPRRIMRIIGCGWARGVEVAERWHHSEEDLTAWGVYQAVRGARAAAGWMQSCKSPADIPSEHGVDGSRVVGRL